MWWWVAWASAQEVTELTLAEATELARSGPDRSAALARADALDGVARQVGAAWKPVVTVTGAYVRNDHEVVLSFSDLFAGLPVPLEEPLPDATLQPLEALTVSGAVRVPLLVPSAWAEGTAARRSAASAELQADELDHAIGAGLVAAAAGVEAAEGLLAASEEALEVAREHLRATETARTVGTATTVDALTAEANVARREGEVVTARQAVLEAREALGALLGLPGPARVTWPEGEAAVGEATERPALQAARTDLSAAEARVDAARLRWLPTVAASGAALASTVAYPTGLKTAWRVGVDATFVLYDGGLRGGRVDQVLAERRAATVALDRQEREVDRALRESDADVRAAREALGLAERQAGLAERAAEVARRGLEAGTSTALVAREADAEAFRADVGVVAARARLRTALAEARRARGQPGGW